MNKADVQAVRICLSENQNELSMNLLCTISDLLTYYLSASEDDLLDAEGELLFVLLQLDAIKNLPIDINSLVAELKLRLVRLAKRSPRIIRGKDSLDILSDKRDAEGYITDLTLIRPPYETQRIIHRDGGPTEFTEEIYIDSLGRYFRKIYDVVEINRRSDSAIAEDILSEFDLPADEPQE